MFPNLDSIPNTHVNVGSNFINGKAHYSSMSYHSCQKSITPKIYCAKLPKNLMSDIREV